MRSKGEYAPIPTSAGDEDLNHKLHQPHCTRGEVQTLYCHRWLEGDFSIIPDERPWVARWDILLSSALSFTAVLLPLDVAILKNSSSFVNYVINATDTIFLVDIFLILNTAYSVRTPGHKSETYEARPYMIARRYMALPLSQNYEAGWFWPDMLTITPWDLILPYIGLRLASVRAIRLLRLLRVLRLVRVVKLFKTWHTRVGMSLGLLKIVTCAVTTLILVHWLACAWAHLGMNPNVYGQSSGGTSWLTHYLHKETAIEDISGCEAYFSSLYFCTVVLTTVGFGDVVPINQVEVVAMTVTVFLTGVTWAWVVGNIVNVITNLDSFGNVFNAAMDNLNALMKESGVGQPLRIRIRKHLNESYSVQRRKFARESMSWLTEGLQGELAVGSGVDKICECIWYFKGLPQNILIEIADEFKPNLFSPNETIISRDSASVIVRGSCLKSGRLLTRDSVFGEDMILVSAHLRDTSCPLTLSFLEVMTIQRDDMMEACEKYPEFNARLRRAQIRLAIWREFIHIAARIHQEHRRSLGITDSFERTPVKRKSSKWERHFFSIGKMSKPGGENSRYSGPGFKESFQEQGQDSNESNINKVLEVVQSIREEAQANRAVTQTLVESFEARFDHLEKHMGLLGTKVEALAISARQPMVAVNSDNEGTRNQHSPSRTGAYSSVFDRVRRNTTKS